MSEQDRTRLVKTIFAFFHPPRLSNDFDRYTRSEYAIKNPGALHKPIQAFSDAIQTLKRVDGELVTIQKVTDATDGDIKNLTDSAYDLAAAYGRTADSVLSASAAFAKAGYGDQIEEMTELSLLLQNVGDVSEETATKTLLAADAAWKLGGNEAELAKIIDGFNQVSNTHAVDVQALSEGLTVAGSVFAESGESAATYTGLVGAAVAATQRSGGEIARASRTILMNMPHWTML